MRVVELDKIRIDGGTQPRKEIDQKTVDDYAHAYSVLVRMPPLVVYFDGADTWLADGFHRYHAAMKVGVQAVDVDWREGTLEKAKFYAASANVGHGLPRSDDDKQRAIQMLLETSEGMKWAKQNSEAGRKKIAAHCGVMLEFATIELGKRGNSNHDEKTGKFTKGSQTTNGHELGRGRDYQLARLRRDRPDLAARVESGEVTAKEAAKEAGIVKPPDPVKAIRKAIAKHTGVPVDRMDESTEDPVVEPKKPTQLYSSVNVADTANVIIGTGRIARGAFSEADWQTLLKQWDEMIAVREYGPKEAS